MSLNEVPSANRVHIGFFGKRNSGKSSLVNAVTGQSLSLVSEVPGTTTDPVMKAMELLPLGPVVMMDTPGIDDEGMLGQMRVEKTWQILHKTHIAVLVVDGSLTPSTEEDELLREIKKREIPVLIAVNKEEQMSLDNIKDWNEFGGDVSHVFVSALEKSNIDTLKEEIGKLAATGEKSAPLVSDLVSKGDFVILVTPIDEAAPKGRLILPQQQVIRDLLDVGAIPVVMREKELEKAFSTVGHLVKMVITDSQAFSFVSKNIPENVPLTSFSILFARYKGLLWDAVSGAEEIDKLTDGDTILLSEGCTHHRQCGDIGRDKLPAWLQSYTGKELCFEWSSGNSFPQELGCYRLIIHCGACMLNDREMRYRARCAKEQGVALTNYGTAIAHMNGILDRSIAPLLPSAI